MLQRGEPATLNGGERNGVSCNADKTLQIVGKYGSSTSVEKPLQIRYYGTKPCQTYRDNCWAGTNISVQNCNVFGKFSTSCLSDVRLVAQFQQKV